VTNPYDDLLDTAPQSPAPVPPPAAPAAAPRPARGQPATNPYLDLIPDADNTGKAALTVGLSSDRNAAAAATDMALAKKYKTTPQVVAAFPEDFRQRAQMELARDALAKAPALSKAIVNNPALAAAAHPEVPKLSLVNQAIDALGQTARYVTGAGGGRSVATDVLAIGGAASRAVSPLFEKIFMAAGGLASLADSTDKYGARTPNILSDAAFKAVDFFKETGKAGAPGADAGLWDKALDMAGQTGGIVMEALATGGEAPVARAGAGMWSVLGGMASQGVRSMMVPATLASDKTFADVIEKGGTVAEATKAASATYMTTTLSGVLPLATPGKLSFRLGAGAASGLTQGEVSRQIMSAALPDSMQPQAPTTDDYILEALAGAVFGGLAGPRDVSVMQRRATEAARRTYVDAAQVEHAKQGAEAIGKISELAANSELRKNSPDTFKQLVRDMTDDAGTPELYVDAKRLAEAMDTAGLDAAFLQTNMPEVAEQMREALQSEGLVRVPVEDYATHLAGTPADAALQQHLRVDPEGKTFGEAQQAQQGDAARFQAEAEKVLSQHEKDSAFHDSAREVHDNVLGQLKAVNRFPSDVNKAYAAMTRDFYTTLAGRLGVTPKEAVDRYPLQIRAEALPGGGAAFDQGAPKGLTIEGYHFSKQARQTLDSYHFGTGLQGSGREMFQGSADKRLTKRLSFYADKGTGINPEAGVGGFAHRVLLEGVYDANADPLRLRRGGQLAFESAVLDHGYKGYIDRLAGTQSAQVIMLGDHILRPEQLGPQTKITEGTKRVPAPEMTPSLGRDVTVDALNANKLLPPGSVTLERWGEILAQRAPAEFAAFKEAGVFDGKQSEQLYKSELVKRFMDATPAPDYAAASAEGAGVFGQGGVRGSDGLLAGAGRPGAGAGREADGSLRGLPREVGGFKASAAPEVQKVAAAYMAKAGLKYDPPSEYAKVDPERAKRIAQAFDEMKHDPQNPEVKAAYAKMVDEVGAQYQAALDAGLKVEFVKGEDPYAGNPRAMTEDVRNNNHMWVFSTRDGFGTDAKFDPVDNPLLAETTFEISGQKALANDLFRVVHDYFGHVKEGVGFRAAGEENAWQAHMAMFSPEARRAATTETRGQNSWLNYGPYGEKNRTAKVEDTHFADQKVGLLPEWVTTEGYLGDQGAATYAQSAKFSEDNRLSNLRMDGPSWQRIRENNPALKNARSADDEVTIYRATVGDTIRPDDYVAVSKATLRAELANVRERDGAGAKIVEMKVKVGDLLMGNDATEFVYFPKADGGTYLQTLPAAWPTSKKVATSLGNITLPDMATLKAEPVQYEKAVHAVASEPGMKTKARSVDGKAKAVVDRMTENLLWLHDAVPAEVRDRSKLWYDGAQRIAEGWTEKWGKTRAQTAGMLAALSPQKDWFMNVTMAERVGDILSGQQNHAWDAKMTAAAFRFLLAEATKPEGEKGNSKIVEAIKGKTLAEVVASGDRRAAGIWIRAYDEAYHGTGLAVISPEGTFEGKRTTGKGTEASRAWGDFTAIGKAASIFNDGTLENINAQIGGEHKVRNFYNNIFNASDPRFTTIDTHAVASALLRPLTGSDRAVSDNFGATGGSSTTGVSGTYPLYYEAYRKAAEARGILPREMQSITWEAVRGLFKDTFKTDANKKAVDAIWKAVDAGHATPEEARSQIEKLAGGIDQPEWWGTPAQSLAGTTYDAKRGEFTGAKVTFEVAPDPNNTALKAEWDALPPEVRQEVSHQIAWKVASQALAHLKIAGELHQQMGGYGADTNPSLSLWLNKETSASKALELGTLLGYALNQDAMMVTSPKAFKGGDEWGTVAVHGVTPETAAKVYDELRAKVLGPDGEPLIQGHTTGGDTMVILAPKDQAEAIAKQAAEALGDRHDVSSDALHVAWPEKGENDYGLSGQKTTVRSGSEPPLRTVADRLRGEAAAELARALEGQGAANDPGRAEFGQPQGWGAIEGDPAAAAEALKPRAGSLGQISFGKDITQQPSVITLFEKANLTTFLHESGHFFLEVYSDVASRADAPPLIAKDMGALLDWFGMKAEGDPLTSWRAMPADAKREFHEKFARGFEAYLMEGKAPTPGLQGLFSRFASWLVQTYRSIAGLHVELTPEVRGVMDRMLASEETIRQSEDASGMLPLFAEKPPGMDAEAYARYQALGQEATDSAVADLQHRGARDMKWLSNAQSAALKAEQAKAETARAAIRDEVTLEVDAHPAFQAKAFLDDKANKGADLDFVADQFGYSSGEEMVQAISDVGNRADVIAAMTDQRMLAEHGDLVDERAVAKAASAAIHNDVRLRFLATELRTLAQATGSARATAQAAKQAAEASVSAKRVRDLRPGQYEAAEARAGKASAEAFKAGDVQTAAVQKRAQILSHALARAAGEAQVEAEKAVKYLKKFEKEGVRKALPADYLVQIDALLDKHDLRQTSMKAADETRTLRAWVQSRLNAGEIPPLSENLLSPKERKAYQDQISIRDENGNLVFADPEEQIKLLADAIESGARTSHIDMTVEGLRGLRDTVRTIEHMGRQAGKILTAEEHATYQGVRDEIVASLERNATRSGLGDRTSNTRLGEAVQGIKQFAVSHLRPATWAQIMDGGEANGALWKYLIKPANDRMAHETTRKAQATEALAAVLSPILKNVTLRDKAGSGKYFKELGTSLNWQERFAFLLNYGNESNLQRLKDGGIAGVSKALTDAQIQTVLRTMTAAELRAAQAVWDHLETYRPEIAALERKMTGKEPEWIQPRPFSVRSVDGELVHLEGGYYPVVFDPRGSLQAQQHAQAQEAKTLSRAAYSAATTSRSFTKQRVDEVVGRPLLLNLSGLYRGVNDVIHDLSFREWTVDANKLLRSKTIDASIRDHYGPEVKRTMEKWRDDLVAGTRNLDHGVEQASAFARRHVSMAGLSFNVMSAAIQPLGLTQSMARVGVKWTAKGVADYIARRGELTQEVHAQSEFMRNRGSTAFRELAELGAQVKGQTKWGEFRDRYAFWMTAAAQGLVDIPTWRGAHLKALAEGFDDATAVALADQAVKDSQGGGELVDLAGIERGPAVTKLFTVFYSFMNTALNTGALATVHASGKADLAIKLALTAVIPTVLGKVFRDAMTPGDSENYEDWEKTMKTLAAEQAQFMLGLVVFVREFAGVTRTLTGEKDMGYSGPTGLRIIPDAGKLAKQAMQGEFDTAFRKALLNFMGDVFGIPSAQINKTWNGMEALIAGETENPMALIAGHQKPQP
jgi:hypothetical protein